VIAAGLLHDVLEDCNVTSEQLCDNFGKEVLTLVDGVTKIKAVEDFVNQDSERIRDLQELESLRKLLIAMAEDDIRIIFIKLADRCITCALWERSNPRTNCGWRVKRWRFSPPWPVAWEFGCGKRSWKTFRFAI
jgi:(p)ppGpp synthase/HD superfamily hydrolase